MENIQKVFASARSSAAANGRAAPEITRPVRPLPSEASDNWARLPEVQFDSAALNAKGVVAHRPCREALAYDVLRTKVVQQMRANGWRRLGITSPSTGCGKSTVALNLGLSLARLREKRLVLAELDLRRPSLAETLGVPMTVDFANVVAGEISFAWQAVRHGGNFALGLNAGPVKDPAELLQTSVVAEVLTEIEREFAPDAMIFDLPPVLVCDDTIAFTQHLDCVLLVAEAEATTTREVDICERELARQTNVMGVVLNKSRYGGTDDGYSPYG